MVFQSPMGNLEAGGGIVTSSLEHQSGAKQTDYLGNGHYFVLGLNHFTSAKTSIFLRGRRFEENLARHGGDNSNSAIQSDSYSLGFGLNIWL